jgi:hypothetical protein
MPWSQGLSAVARCRAPSHAGKKNSSLIREPARMTQISCSAVILERSPYPLCPPINTAIPAKTSTTPTRS